MSAGAAILGVSATSGGGTLTAATPGGIIRASGASGSHTFGTLTCIASGGTGPYTYLWGPPVQFADDPATWTGGGATTASITPAVSGVSGAGDFSRASYSCTVTDSLGAKATSNVTSLNWQNTSGG